MSIQSRRVSLKMRWLDNTSARWAYVTFHLNDFSASTFFFFFSKEFGVSSSRVWCHILHDFWFARFVSNWSPDSFIWCWLALINSFFFHVLLPLSLSSVRTVFEFGKDLLPEDRYWSSKVAMTKTWPLPTTLFLDKFPQWQT